MILNTRFYYCKLKFNFFSFLTLVAALTVAGIPSGGIVTTILILDGLNINQNQIGLILTVDWFM